MKKILSKSRTEDEVECVDGDADGGMSVSDWS